MFIILFATTSTRTTSTPSTHRCCRPCARAASLLRRPRTQAARLPDVTLAHERYVLPDASLVHELHVLLVAPLVHEPLLLGLGGWLLRLILFSGPPTDALRPRLFLLIDPRPSPCSPLVPRIPSVGVEAGGEDTHSPALDYSTLIDYCCI